MKYLIVLILVVSFTSCNKKPESNHAEPTHNFTVERLIILNEENEIFMTKDEDIWGAPAFLFSERQYVKESVDSLANAFGLSITTPELRGYFGFKYEYHPFATRRAFYVAKRTGGTPKMPESIGEYKWMTLDEVIENSVVDAWKYIFPKIIDNPQTVWGASFEVYRDGEEHRTRTTEAFYPLFTSNILIDGMTVE